MENLLELSLVLYFVIGLVIFLFLNIKLNFSGWISFFGAFILVGLLIEFPWIILIVGLVTFFIVKTRNRKYLTIGLTLLLVVTGNYLNYDESVHNPHIKKIVKHKNVSDYLKQTDTNKYGYDITVNSADHTSNLPSDIREKSFVEYSFSVYMNEEFWSLSESDQFDMVTEIAKLLKNKKVENGLHAGYYGTVNFNYYSFNSSTAGYNFDNWTVVVHEEIPKINGLTKAEWIESNGVVVNKESENKVDDSNAETISGNVDDSEETETVVSQDVKVSNQTLESAPDKDKSTETSEQEEETASDSEYYYDEVEYEDGSSYKGNFVNGLYHGYGMFFWADGAIYDGDFANGSFHGHGVLTWPEGTRYEGAFQNGQQNGHGLMTWPDGTRYEGEFINGQPNGQGEMKWSDGKSFKGVFKDGNYTDEGEWVYPD